MKWTVKEKLASVKSKSTVCKSIGSGKINFIIVILFEYQNIFDKYLILYDIPTVALSHEFALCNDHRE